MRPILEPVGGLVDIAELARDYPLASQPTRTFVVATDLLGKGSLEAGASFAYLVRGLGRSLSVAFPF